ncbi:MAG: S8 family serine peptidase [Planctomycetota bacterium]|jgi:hypothetical protein
MIEFQCQSCGHKIVVRDDISGKEVKCQKCGLENVVPSIYFNNEASNADAPSEDTSKKEDEVKDESDEPYQLAEEQPIENPIQQIEKEEKHSLNNSFKYIISIAVAVLFVLCITLLILLNKAQMKEAIRGVELTNQQTIEKMKKETAVLNERLSHIQNDLDTTKLDNEELAKANIFLQEQLVILNKELEEIQNSQITASITEENKQSESNNLEPVEETSIQEYPFEVESYRLPNGNIADKIDYPFVNDPDVIGTWISVDFVTEPEQFKVGQKQFGGKLFLKELVFMPKGRMANRGSKWTKDLVLDAADKTASRYIIKELNGSAYMFFEWKSGDYTIRHMKPKYYVLKKQRKRISGQDKNDKSVSRNNQDNTLYTRINADLLETIKEFDDVRSKDLRDYDFSIRPNFIPTLTFNKLTVWPEPARMPLGFTPEQIITNAMNPGLGVRGLHQQGITGKGVNVAIIDQPLYLDHPEIAGKIAAYHDTGCETDESSMHGPLVSSLLVGTNCGTAPDARVYYAAAPSWKADATYYAKGLNWIIEQNKNLPASQKIRVVSVSASPNQTSWKNRQMWDKACAQAEADGILMLDCTNSHRGFIGRCWYNPNNPDNVSWCKPGVPGQSSGSNTEDILVPSSPRTAAEDGSVPGYQYAGRGGLSRSIPYCAGVLAMGWQVRPDLTDKEMKRILFKTAYINKDRVKIIYPVRFIQYLSTPH